ncbi:MAG TPA: hypothetical protein GX687_04045 [Clostridia bacterium]|jgi:hypothetical protein|nr:hypothetical protein [Clostridia bacterium]
MKYGIPAKYLKHFKPQHRFGSQKKHRLDQAIEMAKVTRVHQEADKLYPNATSWIGPREEQTTRSEQDLGELGK